MKQTVGSTAALAVLALLACKRGDDDGSEPVPVVAPAPPVAPAAASPEPAGKATGSGKTLFESDLADACNQVPQKAAIEYARPGSSRNTRRTRARSSTRRRSP